MYNVDKHGIKLLVSIYSYNALSSDAEFYGKWYRTGDFYTNSNTMQYFKNRIVHIMIIYTISTASLKATEEM